MDVNTTITLISDIVLFDVQKYHFILFLVDYNPNSTNLDLGKLKKLPFSDQFRVFRGGFTMWEQNTKSIF